MYPLNLSKSPKDNRDYIINLKENSDNSSLSRFCDLSGYCSIIKNQGSVGSCTAHASIAGLELLCKKYLKDNKSQFETLEDIFSEKFLYYVTRVNIAGEKENEDTGCYLRDSVKALTKYGVCLEKSMPYDNKFSEKPSEENYKEALNYQTTRYARIMEHSENFLLELKNVLSNGIPVICGITCYENMFQSKNGIIPLPKGKIVGGHAILIVGYDDNSKILKFKNSWGSDWGHNGYGYLYYDYIIGNALEAWVIYDTEIANMELSSFNKKNDHVKDIAKFIFDNINSLEVSKIKEKIENENITGREKQVLNAFLLKVNSAYTNMCKSLEI
jgi:C1A family cysteine protease